LDFGIQDSAQFGQNLETEVERCWILATVARFRFMP